MPEANEVTRVRTEGTQIDPVDGQRKPVEEIEREDPPEFSTVTDAFGHQVHTENRAGTQIGSDGKRHPIED